MRASSSSLAWTSMRRICGKTFCHKPEGSLTQGNGDKGDVVHDKYMYRFSTVVFASWDYHLTDYEAAANLRRSIRQQLKEMLNDASDADVQVTVYARIMGQMRKAGTLEDNLFPQTCIQNSLAHSAYHAPL